MGLSLTMPFPLLSLPCLVLGGQPLSVHSFFMTLSYFLLSNANPPLPALLVLGGQDIFCPELIHHIAHCHTFYYLDAEMTDNNEIININLGD